MTPTLKVYPHGNMGIKKHLKEKEKKVLMF